MLSSPVWTRVRMTWLISRLVHSSHPASPASSLYVVEWIQSSRRTHTVLETAETFCLDQRDLQRISQTPHASHVHDKEQDTRRDDRAAHNPKHLSLVSSHLVSAHLSRHDSRPK